MQREQVLRWALAGATILALAGLVFLPIKPGVAAEAGGIEPIGSQPCLTGQKNIS